jgi:hypothetical protein
MSDKSGMAAVDEAAATITNGEHAKAVATAREEGRKAGLAEAQAGVAIARTEGAAAERTRLAGIDAAGLPGHDKLIAECKADPTCSPGDAALKVTAAERAKLGAAHVSIQNVETATGHVAAAVTTVGKPAVPQNAEGWKAEYEASTDLQAKFPTVGSYVATKSHDQRKNGGA